MFTIATTDAYEKWYAALKDASAKYRIAERLRRIELYDHFGDVASVGHGVSELRFFFGSGYRIYYIIKNGVVVVLLAGGDKGSQSRDIQKAIELAEALQ